MGQNFQQVASRKENISAIEPLVSAMRTISLSQWRMALNRHETLESFLPLLDEAYAVLEANAGNAYTQSETTEKTLIILGSNRGLCGAFNKHLLRYARKKDMAATDFNEVYLTGNKLPALFKPMGFENMISLAFPDISAIPDAMQLFQLESIEQLTGKSIFILFNQYQGAGRYKTVSEQIYPLKPQDRSEKRLEALESIIDTDARSLGLRLRQLSFSSRLQATLYSSMASEHSARFALMENADQNIENLISELEIILQDYRKGKITAETQELAISSGLLGNK